MVEVKVEGVDTVNAALQRLAKKTEDLTIPLQLIAREFYTATKFIFELKGPGQYEDLKDKTKTAKERDGYNVYPILKRTGRLARSVTEADDPESINVIVNKDTLFIGTRVPYGVFHQEGTSKMPRRPFLLITKPMEKSFVAIIEDYTAKVIRQNGLQA